MTNADRLRSWPCLPSSDRLVDRAVELLAPSTSPHPSLAYQGQRIRSDTRRYTLKGAAFGDLNFISPTAIAPLTSKSEHVHDIVLRKNKHNHRLQNASPPRKVARHIAPLRASGRPCPLPTSTKLKSHRAWSRATNTRNTLKNLLENPQLTPLVLSSTQNHARSLCPRPLLPPTCKQALLRDPPDHGRYTDLCNPMNQLAATR
jgi:hypothetical protein